MEDPDFVSVLDDICRTYHSEASFPAKISDLPQDKEPSSLMRIANLFEQQLTVSHLKDQDLVLIITDGPHGRDLIEYLYRERVFSPERSHQPPKPGFYYIYPRAASGRTNNIANPRSWLPGGFPATTRNKLLESVVTLDLETDVNFMKTTSVFLVELSNGAPSFMALANTVVDAMVQKRVRCVFSILGHQRAKSKDLLAYLGTTLSVIETGNIENHHMFINFDEELPKDSSMEEALECFDTALNKAIKDKEPTKELKNLGNGENEVRRCRYRFQPISVPNDLKLLEYLLGTGEEQLVPLLSSIRKPDFKFKDLETPEKGPNGSKKEEPSDESGVDAVVETLKQAGYEKVRHSLDRMEADIDHLYSISNRFVRAGRSKQIGHFIASFNAPMQQVQDWTLMVVFTAAVFLHILSCMKLRPIDLGHVKHTLGMAEWLIGLTKQYSHKHWITLYVVLILYYAAVKVFGKRFLSIDDMDREKYSTHKTALQHLDTARLRLKQLRRSVAHPGKSTSTRLRRLHLNRI